MMELTIYAVVLGVTSLVTAIPSGYDVRSGAFAGAHAGAGTFSGFGGIPLSIPSAGSYSGSFSKALSSSHASSSASSSSFSFSGTGHIPNAIGNDGSVIQGAGGCSSGSCQSGIKGAPGYGTAGTGSGANAAAIAGAGAFAGSTANSKPCINGDCSSQDQGCTGPNCNYNLNKNKCPSGQCSPSETASTYFEDIPVNTVHSTPANTYNGNGKPHSSLATSSTDGCLNGNCGSASTPKPVYSQTSAGAYPSSSWPVNKPATYLTSPKEQAPCTSPNCGTPTGSVYDTEHLPSSYAVPIQGSYIEPSSPEKTPCSTGNCAPSNSYPSSSSATVDCVSGKCNKTPLPSTDFNTKKPTLSNSQDDIPDFVPLAPTTAANCGTPNCVTSPPTAGSKYPNSLQQGVYSNTFVTGSGSGSNLFSGSYDSTKASSIASSITEKNPPYNGGFGGPPGILKPNEYNLPSKIPTSDYKPSVPSNSYTPPTGSLLPNNQNSSPTGLQYKPTYKPSGPSAPQYQPSPSTGSYKPPCTSGNCGNVPTTPYPIYPPYAPTGPSNDPSYKPTGPSSCTFGNCEVQQLPSESLYKPGVNSAIGCATGNCGTQPQQPDVSTSTSSYVSTTCTSGNCSNKPTKPLSYGNIPTGSFKPTSPGSSFPFACSNGNCGSTQPGLSQGRPYEPASPTGPYKPATCTSGNCDTKPTAPLNYASIPSGIYKPTSPGTSFPSACPYGNCGATQPGLPQGSSYEPTSPTGAYKPSTCISGNCGVQSSQSSSYGQAGTSTSTTIASNDNHAQNKPTYGFSGPPGVLKPNDFSVPAVSLPVNKPTLPGSYNPTSCTSGNCGIQLGPSSPSNNGQYNPTTSGSYKPSSCTYGNCGPQSELNNPSNNGQYKPTGTGFYNPTLCSSGSCGHPPSQFGHNSGAHLSGTAVARANAGIYTGGFGGPPGLLKPYDDGKLIGNGLSPFGNPQPVGSQGDHFGNPSVTGINSSNGKPLTDGIGVAAGASAQAKAFRGGNYEAPDNGANGCKGGCGSSGSGNYGLSGAAVKSQASAGIGAFGFGGSYASSSASAHASAGAITKGGYGKR